MDVWLQRMHEAALERVLRVAVTDAVSEDVMPPVAGPPGWTPRLEAFRAHHRAAGRASPARTPRRTW